MPPKTQPLTLDPGRLDVLARIADAKTAAVRSQNDMRHTLREKLAEAERRQRLHADKVARDYAPRDDRANFAAADNEPARLEREVDDLRRQAADNEAEIVALSREGGVAREAYRRALGLACQEGLPLSERHLEAARVAKFDTMRSELAGFSVEVDR
ncbi:hypothetical protein [Cereibacter azotoformans]|uniref:hypothetical protein n=1 Tax=Cereibacter azotoformans TaxID=43057 RepID=UPI000C6DCCBF|nr:hypothetical protein [Cereibacter azotoformans]